MFTARNIQFGDPASVGEVAKPSEDPCTVEPNGPAQRAQRNQTLKIGTSPVGRWHGRQWEPLRGILRSVTADDYRCMIQLPQYATAVLGNGAGLSYRIHERSLAPRSSAAGVRRSATCEGDIVKVKDS